MIRFARPAVLALAALCWPGTGAAQTPSPVDDDRLAFDWGAGLLLSVPDDFERDPCGALLGFEARAGAGVAVSPRLALESSLAVGGTHQESCAFDTPPLPENGTVTRHVVGDGVDRNPFVSSAHRFVVQLAPSMRISPLGFLGGGRFWTKGTWYWAAGVGLRLGAGPSHWTIEVEQSHFDLSFTNETDLYRDGALVSTTSSPAMAQRASLWSIRVRRVVR